MGGWTPQSPWRMVSGTAQKLTATATSQQSSAVGTQTRAILLSVETANVRVEIGPDPTATATSFILKTTDDPLVIGCAPGDIIAVIQDSSGGVLSIIELTH